LSALKFGHIETIQWMGLLNLIEVDDGGWWNISDNTLGTLGYAKNTQIGIKAHYISHAIKALSG
jgi:hypothetical protein